MRPDLTVATVARWAQAEAPSTATAVFGPGSTPSSEDMRDATVHYLNVDGREVNTATYSGTTVENWNISTTQYDRWGHVTSELSARNRAEALNPTGNAGSLIGLPADSRAAAVALSTINRFTADGKDLTETYGPLHTIGSAPSAVDSLPVRIWSSLRRSSDAQGTAVGVPS